MNECLYVANKAKFIDRLTTGKLKPTSVNSQWNLSPKQKNEESIATC